MYIQLVNTKNVNSYRIKFDNINFCAKQHVVKNLTEEILKDSSKALAATAIAGIALNSSKNLLVDNSTNFRLSRIEFEEKKENLENLIQDKHKSFREAFIDLNKTNIFLYEKLLENEILYNNEFIQKNLWQIINSKSYSIAEIKSKLKIIDDFLKENKLSHSEEIKNNIDKIINCTNENNIDLVQKMFSLKMLHSDDFKVIFDSIDVILNHCLNKNLTKFKCQLLDKYAGDKKLISDVKIRNCMKDFLICTDVSNEFEISDFILSDKKLRINSNILKNLPSIIKYNASDEEVKIIKNILSSKQIRNKNFIINEINKYVDFLTENPNIDKNKFYQYLSSFDLKQCLKAAPIMKSYSDSDIALFLIMHYKLGTKNFTNESLSLTDDLTPYLINAKPSLNLYDVMKIYPNTNRNLGALPPDWGSLVNNISDIEPKVREVIENFVSYSNPDSAIDVFLNDTSNFADDLMDIFKKNINVEYIGSGMYSDVYKIDMEGAKPVVLKVFKQNNIKSPRHGQWAEVPRAFFLNKYNDNFTYTYLGKLPQPVETKYNYEYLLTEYVENDNIKRPVQTKFSDEKYIIKCYDVWEGHNVKSGKIYDLGNIVIIQKNFDDSEIEIETIIDEIKNICNPS